MCRTRFFCLSLLTMSLLLLAGLPAHAVNSCTASNPNTTSVIETTPTADFVVHGNGTVTHSKTGLMWKVCPEGTSGAACATGTPNTSMIWNQALQAANAANAAAFAGYGDWRLPNVKELETIVERCGFNNSVNNVIFPAMFGGQYWTSTTYAPDVTKAWFVTFDVGQTDFRFKTVLGSARLVRGGQSYDGLRNGKPNCTLDVDGNGSPDALTDGLMLIRAMFGLTGTAVTNNAVGTNPQRSTWAQIRPFLNGACGTNFQP